MIDRSLRNDDIEGSKPKSLTCKKIAIKKQQEASIFSSPSSFSKLKNNPIGEYRKTEGVQTEKKTHNKVKMYHFQNNIFGIDIDYNQKNSFERPKKENQNLDSLDRFQKDFENKSFDTKIIQESNTLDVFILFLFFYYPFFYI